MIERRVAVAPPTPWQLVGGLLASNGADLVKLDRRGESGLVAIVRIAQGTYRVQVDRLAEADP